MDQTSFTNFVAHTPDLSAASEPAASLPAVTSQPRPLLKTFADVDAYICGHPDSPPSGRGPFAQAVAGPPGA
jgi:hypothetical protein